MIGKIPMVFVMPITANHATWFFLADFQSAINFQTRSQITAISNKAGNKDYQIFP